MPGKLWETSLPGAGGVLQAQGNHLGQELGLLDGAPDSAWLSGNCSVHTKLHSRTEIQTYSKRQEHTGYPKTPVTAQKAQLKVLRIEADSPQLRQGINTI